MDLKRLEGTNIYEFRVTGKLTENEVNKVQQSFREFRERGEKIKLLGVIDEIPMPELSSFDDIVSLKIDAFKVIEKYAVLSDKNWVEKWVPVANFFTPGMPTKAFTLHEKDHALEWLENTEFKTYAPEDYLANISITEIGEDTFQVEFSHETLTYASMSALYELFSRKAKSKINLLVILNEFPSIENLKTLVKGLQTDLSAYGKIEKYAVVTDKKWIDKLSGFVNFITPGIDIKTFDKEEEKEAKHWILTR